MGFGFFGVLLGPLGCIRYRACSVYGVLSLGRCSSQDPGLRVQGRVQRAWGLGVRV